MDWIGLDLENWTHVQLWSIYCLYCSLVVVLCSFLQLHNHLSSSQVLSTRFCFTSLGSLIVIRFICSRVHCLVHASMVYYCNMV